MSRVLGSAYGGETAAPSGNLNIIQQGPGNALIDFVINSNDSVVLNLDNQYQETRFFEALVPKNIGCGLKLDDEHIDNQCFKVYGFDVRNKVWVNIFDDVEITELLDTSIVESEVDCMTKLNISFDINTSGVQKEWCDYIICYKAQLRYSVCYSLAGCEKFTVRLANLSDKNDTTADTIYPVTVKDEEVVAPSTLRP